ncbi:MAG: FMN-dependent NADH-azoreductase [Synechococcales cyanobacterium RM1_1_8]|nr:FMN-dependent NADH-azoreductase [Synechococcales cyanobacterium RM1_1_8]
MSQPPILLHLDSSARLAGSASRALTAAFVQAWQTRHGATQPAVSSGANLDANLGASLSAGSSQQPQVIYRDLGQQPLPAIDQTWVAAYETEPEARTGEMMAAIALSDQLLDELFAADYYVFGVPMYNLTIPTALKAYLDQVVRRDRSLDLSQGKPQGCLTGKKALVITTRKFNYRPGTEAASRNFLEPYLEAIFKIMGIADLTFVVADRLGEGAEVRAERLAQAEQELLQLAQYW